MPQRICAVSLTRVMLSGMVLLGFCSANTGGAEESAARRERFLREAPPAWEAYWSFAKRLQAVNHHKTSDGREVNGPLKQRVQGETKQCGPWTNSIITVSGPLPLRLGVPAATARVVNSKYAFVLEKRKPDSEWVLTTLDLDLSDDSPINPREREKHVLKSFHAHLNIHGRLFPEMVNGKEFRLIAVTPVGREGQEFVRVEFEDRAQTREDREMWLWIKGWVLLDPGRYWVIRECQVNTGHLGNVEGTISFVNEYKESKDGFPIPTGSIMRKKFASEGKSREEITVSTYDWHEQESLPESEFTLSAFGLPEPPGIEWKKPTPWYLWLGLAGIVCLVLGVGLYWLRWRKIANTG